MREIFRKYLSIFFLIIIIPLTTNSAAGQYVNSSDIYTNYSDVPFIQPENNIDAYNSRAFSYATSIGPAKFFLNNPSAMTIIANQAGQLDVTAGTMTPDGVWWGGTLSLHQLIKIDTSTGARTVIGTMSLIGGFFVTGFAYDITTSTMFVSAANATTTALYTVNLTNAQITILGTSSVCLMDIACSNSGVLYGIDINADNFGTINKVNGVFTIIGPIGYSADLFQGMSWDRSTDSCWITSFHYNPTQCELRRMNIQTGGSSIVGVFQNVSSVDALSIKSPLPLPAAPTLVSPANNSTGISLTPTLDWVDVATATSYGVQVSTSPTFNTTIVNQTGLSSSQYTIPNSVLQHNTIYFWRVNAVNPSGTGQWSSVWNFTTIISAPSAPVLVAPPNGSTGQSLTPILDWTDVPTAQTYRLNVSTDSNFTNTVINQGGLSASQYGVQFNTLLNGVTYYWRVNATNTTGTGPWSTTWKFTTGLVGINNYNTGIPQVYKLYNNYPNPFNPSTMIRFDIPKENGKVTLTVYDINGKEVSKIVNNILSPGKYEIEFSGNELTSGIYFYRIVAGEYTNVKKMILVK